MDQKTVATLQTINPVTGKPPESRIASASMVKDIAQRFRESDSGRAIKRERIQKQLDGSAPYNEDYLNKTGQSDRSNVPFREGEGHVDARMTTYYNLIFDVPCLVTCKLNDPKLRDRTYAQTIAEKFHDMLIKWPGFLYNMMLHQDEMVKHGIGPVYFPDERSWKFEAIKNGSFLVDSGVKSTIDSLPHCVIRGQYQAHELFWKMFATQDEIEKGITDSDKQKVAKEHGWNVDLAKRLIVEANRGGAKKDDQYQTSVWESIQQQIKNNDTLYSSVMSELIFVDHVFIREFRGKVSWYIVPENTTEPEYLFSQKNKYDNFTNLVALFFAGIGDGSYHSVKGLGTKMFSHVAINDRVKNTLVDGLNLKNTLVVQGDVADVRRIKVGRCTVIPNNVKIVTNAFDPDIEGGILVSNFLERSLARNVGTDRPDLDDNDGKKPNNVLGEKLRLMREGKLERKDVMVYYQQADALYREIKNRVFVEGLSEQDSAYESVKEFKQACIDAGVPEALLKNKSFTIEATRAIGFGSPAQAREIMSEVVSIAAHFPEIGKMNAVRDYTSILVGHRQVDRYIPEDNSARDPSNQTSFAVLENSMMEEGGNVLVGKDQLQIVHCEVHFEPIEQIAQQFVSSQGQLGENPLQMRDFFMADLGHIAQHMDLIKDDPTRKPEYLDFMQRFDQMTKVFSAIDKETKKLQAQLDQQRQAMQPPANTGSPADLAKVQAEKELGMIHEANRQSINEAKTVHAMQIKEMVAQQKMRLESEKAKST